VKEILNQRLRLAMREALGSLADDVDPLLRPSARPEHGDYQANFAMALAKRLGQNPRAIAEAVVAALNTQNPPEFSKIDIAGPGFINLSLSDLWLAKFAYDLSNDERLGISTKSTPEIVVVDYANANVAKEMHVGHIRSIVIGDAIVRLLSFLGDQCIRQSHLGDWGTQFGMLIEYLIESGQANAQHTVTGLDRVYKASKQRFDADPEFATRARRRVVALQQGDAETLAIWQNLVKESLHYFQQIYDKLDVLMTEDDARGESYYNPMLPSLVEQLEEKGFVIDSEGAKVFPLADFEIPMIVRKQDGGYLYATTDLAAATFRTDNLKATRLIYLTDARQKQHFAMLFAALRVASIVPENVQLEHIAFGAILGPDNKPFKTRSGESIRLIELLNEAEERAKQLALSKNPNLHSAQLDKIAHAIGIGALKYADLRADKVKDYVFDWDKLLSFEGNTAPYLQNAYVRIAAIFRKAGVDLTQQPVSSSVTSIEIHSSEERALLLQLIQFKDLLNSVAADLCLHRLCDYLYELAAAFHRFYEHCPILSITDADLKETRLLICRLSARTLSCGLELLGIPVIEQM
jgi:arginyl-tRNA synthetase